MADIIELTTTRLPFEIANVVFSFLGTSPSAKLIDDTLNILEESDLVIEKKNDVIDIGNRFIRHWIWVKVFHRKLNYWKPKPSPIVDVEHTLWLVETLQCSECCCSINTDDNANYEGLCEWCYASHLGHEIFTCSSCDYKSTENDDMWLQNNNWYCRYCGLPSDEETETEDEEDENEFWDE